MCNLGTKIKELRLKHGYTQSMLAEKLGVSDKMVSKWENGETSPSVELLPEIADVFNINMDELFSRNHNDFSNIQRIIWEYMSSFSVKDAFDEANRLCSYIILGMEHREMKDMACYSNEALSEITDDLAELIECKDDRLQSCYPDNLKWAWHWERENANVTVVQNLSEDGLNEILKAYSPIKKLFTLLAMDDSEKILRFLLSEDSKTAFTLDYLSGVSSASKDTVTAFLEYLLEVQQRTNEAIIQKETAVISGEETLVYTYNKGAIETLLKSIIVCAYIYTQENRGFR